jgi:hypothetical protein
MTGAQLEIEVEREVFMSGQPGHESKRIEVVLSARQRGADGGQGFTLRLPLDSSTVLACCLTDASSEDDDAKTHRFQLARASLEVTK